MKCMYCGEYPVNKKIGVFCTQKCAAMWAVEMAQDHRYCRGCQTWRRDTEPCCGSEDVYIPSNTLGVRPD